ncbi:hypothetical protein Tco_0648489 [Tanacetum coccineum]
MSTLKFADTHNMATFLSKPTESDGFEQIVDFLNAHPIKYALTVNPTIYTSCIEQLWSTIKVKTINGESQLDALVDGKKIIITESSVRRDLQLADENGIDCLTNSIIFKQLALMGCDEAVHKELGDSLVRAATTASSLEVEQDSDGEEVFFAEQEVVVKDVSNVVSTTGDATTVNAATTTTATITTVVDITLAQALMEIKSTKPKEKRDKGKGILIEPTKPMKKKDLIRLDEETALKYGYVTKRTKMKPKRTKPSTGMERARKTKAEGVYILNGPTFRTHGHSVVSKVSTNAPSSSTSHFPEIAALADAVNAMLLQKSSPPASVKAIEEICLTCGGPHPYHQCLATDGNAFSEYRDNIKRFYQHRSELQSGEIRYPSS